MPKTPLELLADYLRLYHPDYTVDDVVLTETKGYLQCVKPCPIRNRWPNHPRQEHYHTISIHGVGYPGRNNLGQFISPYLLWQNLHGFLPVES